MGRAGFISISNKGLEAYQSGNLTIIYGKPLKRTQKLENLDQKKAAFARLIDEAFRRGRGARPARPHLPATWTQDSFAEELRNLGQKTCSGQNVGNWRRGKTTCSRDYAYTMANLFFGARPANEAESCSKKDFLDCWLEAHNASKSDVNDLGEEKGIHPSKQWAVYVAKKSAIIAEIGIMPPTPANDPGMFFKR